MANGQDDIPRESKVGTGALDPDWLDADPCQAEVFAEFRSEMDGQWVWLSCTEGEVGAHSVGRYSALLTPERIAAGVSDPAWDAHPGEGHPGFVSYNGDNGWTTDYEATNDRGIELLVVDRTWHGVRPNEVELAQEFRLLFNLWEDRATRTFYDFDGSGNPIKSVAIEEQGVRALTSLVRRYQAAKQMYLALYLDSTLWSSDLPNEDHQWETRDAHLICGYYRCTRAAFDDRPFSRLLGKRLFAPPAREACGIAPFERAKEYHDFVLGTNDVGEELRFTSNPDELANYFGANPDSPHYLTPVYFRRDVLYKYYADTDRYSVEDGYLRCAGLWGVRLDNDQTGHVMIFLGDLGRDMPVDEARYWRSFNIIPPEEGPSETLVRRAFYAQFTDPQSVELRFPRVYSKTSKAWEGAFGWPLFKPLHEDDRHVLHKLHVPFGDTAGEFDEQILYLAKLLVDSLNEEALDGSVEKRKGEKGLAKLERMLDGLGVPNARTLLKPFADVQGLRSRGAVHRKGSDFDITAALGESGRQVGFETLMQSAVVALEALRDIAEGQTAHSD
ncbi:MAG: hypothetical protein ACR2QA_10145 [Solirubrobacteraceae bacterium]